MVEVHPHPELAESDGPESLKPTRFVRMMEKLREFAQVADRDL